MFIYKSVHACKWARVPNGVQEGAPAGMLFTAQKSDWIDKHLYLRWVNEVFLKQIPEEWPVLLLVDGHKAHVTQDAIEAVPWDRVLIFCPLARSSHLLLPLDLSLLVHKKGAGRKHVQPLATLHVCRRWLTNAVLRRCLMSCGTLVLPQKWLEVDLNEPVSFPITPPLSLTTAS